MKRAFRYIVAVAVSSAAAAVSLITGLVVGKLAVEHGIANGFVTAVTISMIGVVTIPPIL